ncbi:uridine kinase [Lacisediminihabitans sp.]|jgi:uridine kinase|uniref:uridine kinase n=1 Tax=Lacisediminihabitans sp. TaxID=2787631 RepID=UPI002F9407DA
MARWAAEKKDQLEALAGEILHNYGSGRAIVAIDGSSAAGTAAFAAALADAMRGAGHKVFVASIRDFRKTHARRESQRAETAESFYGDAFDYSVLQRVLIDPFRASGSTGFVLAAYDEKRDAQLQPKWMTAGKDAILIVEGVFLNRRDLAGLWNYSVWLEVPPPEMDNTEQDNTAHDNTAHDNTEQADAEQGADALYLAEAKPRSAAIAIIDNRDVEHPRRVFADAC